MGVESDGDSRQIILERALMLFGRYSYEGCGVQMICDAAGFTKPTLYHHFGSKRGVLDAVLRQFTVPLLAALDAILPYGGDLPKTLADLARAVLALASRYPTEFRYFVSLLFAPENSASRDAVRETEKILAERLTQMFIDASHDHGNMRDREMLLVAAFMGTLTTFGSLVAQHRLEPGDEVVHRIVHQFSHGIYS